MPYNDPDPSDPNVLVGVELPAHAGTTEDMAYVFAEEFARMGFTGAKIMDIFKTPFYAAAYRAYLEMGEKSIGRIVEECLGVWGRGKIVGRD